MTGDIAISDDRLSVVGPSPRIVVAGLTARRAVRSGIIWGFVFGAGIASSAISYTTIYKTQAERDALAAAYGANNATSALFGPARQLQSVAGFTVFKISMTLIVVGAVWGLLTGTRLLRGEEDTGRWELLVTGQTTRRDATAQALVGLAGGAVALWAVTATITVLTARNAKVDIAAGPALYFALAMVCSAVVFLAVGAVTSQLCATRRQAAGYAAAFLGVAYAIRMVADSGVGLHGLIWASPLGWVEELRPLTAPRPVALIPIIAVTAVLVAVAVYLAGLRDVDASIIADRAHSRAHLRLLGGSTSLAIRLVRPTVIGWWVAIAVSALVYGFIARSAGGTISGSSVHKVFARLGAAGTGARAVLGVCFLVLAVLVAFVGVGQLDAARSEESSGRLDNVLARPVSRASWLAGRVAVAVGVVLLSGMGAGVFAWLGAADQHADVSFGALLQAGVNTVAPALAIMGAGVLAFGIRPRLTSVVSLAVLGWSLFVVVVGGIGAMSHWVLDTSVFHQMAPAPAVSPHWEANAAMTAIGAVAALVGAVAFTRRDLQGD